MEVKFRSTHRTTWVDVFTQSCHNCIFRQPIRDHCRWSWVHTMLELSRGTGAKSRNGCILNGRCWCSVSAWCKNAVHISKNEHMSQTKLVLLAFESTYEFFFILCVWLTYSVYNVFFTRLQENLTNRKVCIWYLINYAGFAVFLGVSCLESLTERGIVIQLTAEHTVFTAVCSLCLQQRPSGALFEASPCNSDVDMVWWHSEAVAKCCLFRPVWATVSPIP